MSACGVVSAQRRQGRFHSLTPGSRRIMVGLVERERWQNDSANRRLQPRLAYRQWRSLESEARQSNEVLH